MIKVVIKAIAKTYPMYIFPTFGLVLSYGKLITTIIMRIVIEYDRYESSDNKKQINIYKLVH